MYSSDDVFLPVIYDSGQDICEIQLNPACHLVNPTWRNRIFRRFRNLLDRAGCCDKFFFARRCFKVERLWYTLDVFVHVRVLSTCF